MGIFEDEPIRKTPIHEIGQDLSLVSVAELAERIEALKAEIARLESDIAAKSSTRTAAEALFKPS